MTVCSFSISARAVGLGWVPIARPLTARVCLVPPKVPGRHPVVDALGKRG